MRDLADAFTIISDIISDSDKHNLSKVQLNALLNAQKAISAVELIGLTLSNTAITE